MDAITLLKEDHKTVEALFKRFEKAGDKAFVAKRDIVDRIIEALSVHAAIEEQLFYPVSRATVPDVEDIVLESLEEHHVVKWVLSELEHMDAEDERFDAKVTVLIENVRHHVEEEENDYFPKVREELGRNALNDLGDAMEEARKTAPTHPHPSAPDTPPGNLVTGAAAGFADRIGDTVSGIAQGSVNAAGDVIATVLRRERTRRSPTGSARARKTAAKVRTDAVDAAEATIEKVQEAKQSSERAASSTARVARDTGSAVSSGISNTAGSARKGAAKTSKAATSGAKGTVTSARKATAATSRTARRGATSAGRTAKAAGKDTAATAKRSTRKVGAAAAGKRSSSNRSNAA